jgi:hypothetical protein
MSSRVWQEGSEGHVQGSRVFLPWHVEASACMGRAAHSSRRLPLLVCLLRPLHASTGRWCPRRRL